MPPSLHFPPAQHAWRSCLPGNVFEGGKGVTGSQRQKGWSGWLAAACACLQSCRTRGAGPYRYLVVLQAGRLVTPGRSPLTHSMRWCALVVAERGCLRLGRSGVPEVKELAASKVEAGGR